MTVIAEAMNKLFDLLTAPFGGAAAWAMVALSVVVGVAMLLLFKVSTNQDRLELAKRRLMGHIYEMGLYQDSLRVLFRIQRDLAAANLRYLGVTLPALVVIILPILLILAQLDARFAHRPFAAGETTLVTAQVAPGREPLLDSLSLVGDAGASVETLPVRDGLAGTATWRVRVTQPGEHAVTLQDGDGGSWTKRLVAGGGLPRLAAEREHAGLHYVLFNPAEKPLPGDAPVRSITADLPGRETRYLGIALNWLVAFCIISLGFGLAVKDVFKVKM